MLGREREDGREAAAACLKHRMLEAVAACLKHLSDASLYLAIGYRPICSHIT